MTTAPLIHVRWSSPVPSINVAKKVVACGAMVAPVLGQVRTLHSVYHRPAFPLSQVAKKVVECGATVVVLDSDLTPLSRTWCLLEIMHCIRCKRHLKVSGMRLCSRDRAARGVKPRI